ncbi:MAG: beta-lactamase family protein [Lachnospiraceae bacterium]|nr:beta-lactamase family protein [Lachnospiraceae bacterium]
MYEVIGDAIGLIEKSVSEGKLCSACIAIGSQNEVYASECFGKTSVLDGAPDVNDKTLYDMASMSKIITVTLLTLKAVDEGLLGLYDKVEDFVNKGLVADNPHSFGEKGKITIFELLTHTSGLSAHYMLWNYINDPEDALGFILESPLLYERGRDVTYSCMGFIVLGKILEFVYGKPLDEISQKYVFKPLGMENTSYHRLNSHLDTKPYCENCVLTEKDTKTGEWLQGVAHDENARFLKGVAGNAGVFSNLSDMIRYASFLSMSSLGKGKYIDDGLFRKAITNQTKGMSQNRGLGFHLAGYDCFTGDLFNRNAFGHTGFCGCHILVSPKTGLYVLLLTNRVHPTRENTALFDIRRELHDILSPLS